MAWENRVRGGMYYTRSRRKNGKVVRQYIGGGVVGNIVAARDAQRKAERYRRQKQWQETRFWLKKIDDAVAEISRNSEQMLRTVLGSLGYHRDKNFVWRKRRKTAMTEEVNIQKIHSTMDAAAKGDDVALREMRDLIEADPWLKTWIKEYGNIGNMVAKTIQERLTGNNLVRRTGLQLNLKELEQTIAGPSATPVEKILAQRIALCALQANFADIIFVQNVSKNLESGEKEYLQLWQDRAHHRLLSALKTWAQMRRLGLPAFQVNIGENQINMMAAEAKAERDEV